MTVVRIKLIWPVMAALISSEETRWRNRETQGPERDTFDETIKFKRLGRKGDNEGSDNENRDEVTGKRKPASRGVYHRYIGIAPEYHNMLNRTHDQTQSEKRKTFQFGRRTLRLENDIQANRWQGHLNLDPYSLNIYIPDYQAVFHDILVQSPG